MSHKKNASSTHKNKRAIVAMNKKPKTPARVTRQQLKAIIKEALADDMRVAVRFRNLRGQQK